MSLDRFPFFWRNQMLAVIMQPIGCAWPLLLCVTQSTGCLCHATNRLRLLCPLVTLCNLVVALFLHPGGCYWTVTLIADAAGVATGLVVIAMVVLPVTVRFSEPLCDACVVESPK